MKRFLLVFVLLLVVVIGVGFFLPGSYEVVRERELPATPEEIHPWLEDLRRWPEWTAWGADHPEIVYTYEGAERGAGAIYSWKEQGDVPSGRVEITHASLDKGVRYDLSIDQGRFVSKGALEYRPRGESTVVVWTMRGELARDPLQRYMGLFMDRFVGSDFEGGLARLEEQLAGEHPDVDADEVGEPGPAQDSSRR